MNNSYSNSRVKRAGGLCVTAINDRANFYNGDDIVAGRRINTYYDPFGLAVADTRFLQRSRAPTKNSTRGTNS
jgi:hypothetical protein